MGTTAPSGTVQIHLRDCVPIPHLIAASPMPSLILASLGVGPAASTYAQAAARRNRQTDRAWSRRQIRSGGSLTISSDRTYMYDSTTYPALPWPDPLSSSASNQALLYEKYGTRSAANNLLVIEDCIDDARDAPRRGQTAGYNTLRIQIRSAKGAFPPTDLNYDLAASLSNRPKANWVDDIDSAADIRRAYGEFDVETQDAIVCRVKYRLEGMWSVLRENGAIGDYTIPCTVRASDFGQQEPIRTQIRR